MKIYFSGSMTIDHSKADLYNEIIQYLAQYGEVLNKFVGEKSFDKPSAKEVFERDTNNLNNADVLIGDISIPSLGVGFELGYFEHKKKPMLLLYDINKLLPSALVRGIPSAIVKKYGTMDEIKECIDNFLK